MYAGEAADIIRTHIAHRSRAIGTGRARRSYIYIRLEITAHIANIARHYRDIESLFVWDKIDGMFHCSRPVCWSVVFCRCVSHHAGCPTCSFSLLHRPPTTVCAERNRFYTWISFGTFRLLRRTVIGMLAVYPRWTKGADCIDFVYELLAPISFVGFRQ